MVDLTVSFGSIFLKYPPAIHLYIQAVKPHNKEYTSLAEYCSVCFAMEIYYPTFVLIRV